MPKKSIKKIFPLLALLLLAPWPVAYAHDYTSEVAGHDAILIEAAETSAAPSMSVFRGSIGCLQPGDLFYIDATENTAEITASLYLVNTQELVHHYRYLILNIGVYVENEAGEWVEAYSSEGEKILEGFITLHNGQISLTLAGSAKYKITINGGSFYCTSTTSDDNTSLSPRFYLEVF